MSGSLELQNALYNKLNADATLGGLIVDIYDNVTQVKDPSDNSEFPFLALSDVNITPWDDDTDKGSDAEVTIHTWSRARHALEAKEIMGAIYDILHRDTLSISGYKFIGMDLTNEDVQRDEDGITRHGIQTFRIVYQET